MQGVEGHGAGQGAGGVLHGVVWMVWMMCRWGVALWGQGTGHWGR